MLPSGGDDGWSDIVYSSELLYPRNEILPAGVAKSLRYSDQLLCVGTHYPNGTYQVVLDSTGEILHSFNYVDCSSIDFCFDQLDRIFTVRQKSNGEVWIYYYDSLTSTMLDRKLADGANPCCAMDDVRVSMSNTSDILVFYQQDELIFFHQQRDRYLTQYPVPHTQVNILLDTCGMSTANRFTVRTVTDEAVLATVQDHKLIAVGDKILGYPWETIPWHKNSYNTPT
jgi:hypothetical protein